MNVKTTSTRITALLTTGILSSTIVTIPPPINRSTAVAQPSNHQSQDLAQSLIVPDLAAFNLASDNNAFIPIHLEQELNNPGGGRGVLGTDDRIEVLSQNYPWSAIGRVEGIDANGEGYICTGTLISADVVLTNAHCVVDATTQESSRAIRFMPNLIEGQIPDAADVAYAQDAYVGTDFSDRSQIPHPDDWAFLKLDKPIGEKYGWLGWATLPAATLSSSEYQEQLVLVGYSGDYPSENPGTTAGAQIDCSIVDEFEGILLHDCDTFGGSSGGPILGLVNDELRIVAVNTAEALDAQSGEAIVNLAIPISRIVAQLND